MARTSKRDLERLRDKIAQLQGRPEQAYIRVDGKSKAQVGALVLNNMGAELGGWDLSEITTTTGGEDSLIGNTFGGRGRLNAHELESFMLGMLAVLDRKVAKEETT